MLEKVQQLGTPIALTLISIIFVVGMQISFESGRSYQAELLQNRQYASAAVLSGQINQALVDEEKLSISNQIFKEFQEKVRSLLGIK